MLYILDAMKTIRVATFNVYYGKNPEGIAVAIKANANLADADVILLQEIEAHESEAFERARIIAEELKMNFVYAPARDTKKLGGTHGLAILSRYPVQALEVVPLREFNLRYNSRKRIAVTAIIDFEGTLVQVCNVHLDLRINIKERIAQIKDVIEKLNQHDVQRIILGGDFNTVPIFWAGRILPIFYARQRHTFNKFIHEQGFQTRLADIGHTMSQKVIRFSLDSIYSRGLEINAFGIERDIKVSDHYPVWVDFEL